VSTVRQAPYAWSSEWSDEDDGSFVMAHSSVVVTRDGHVGTGKANEPALAFRDRDGKVTQVSPVSDVVELHGLELVEEDGSELIWVADSATKVYGGGQELDPRFEAGRGRVLQIDLEGRQRRSLDLPPLAVYGQVPYMPTAVAVDETRFGGTGDIWVADGYGAGLVHRYSADGRYLQSLDGEDGAGKFDQPHDVLIDRRSPVPELYVADRINQRIQVYDLEGSFKRTVGEGLIPGPTQMAVTGTTLVVTDLLAGRLTILDKDDQLVGHFFAHPSPPPSWEEMPDGWPNARASDGRLVGVTLQPGVFHTPHGIGVGSDGTVYVSEFAIGGRIAVLSPVHQ
jgi:hypothetical protein